MRNSPDGVDAGESATTQSFPEFLDALASQRAPGTRVSSMREMANEFVARALTLLFPQLAPSMQHANDTRDVHAQAAALERLLTDAISPWMPHASDVTNAFMSTLPHVHSALNADVTAIVEGDPAAENRDEVILAYPGFLATAVHRLSHELYTLGVPVFPRMISEWAHRETGIDIHPGATIGRAFAIDHGTGVVIGETSHIGDRVKVYQGVTLGALAVNKRLRHTKRHPTIGNDVVLYANATILGGKTVVGDGSIIGGNVWLTSSVPPRSVVQFTSNVEQRAPDDGLEFHI